MGIGSQSEPLTLVFVSERDTEIRAIVEEPRTFWVGVTLARASCMARSQALAEDLVDLDFDPAGQVAIVRRAIAEIPVKEELDLGATTQRLARLSALAEAIVSKLATADQGAAWKKSRRNTLVALREARRELDPSGLALDRLTTIRSQVHHALAQLGEALAVVPRIEEQQCQGVDRLAEALQIRRSVSDVYQAIPWHTSRSSSAAWAVSVARAELKILLKTTFFSSEFEGIHEKLSSLAARLDLWHEGDRDPFSTSRLYNEVFGLSGIMVLLSARSEVKRRDAQSLIELTALLSRQTLDGGTAGRVIEALVALRGLDTTMDRLITNLPLEPVDGLSSILRRVLELRARTAAS